MYRASCAAILFALSTFSYGLQNLEIVKFPSECDGAFVPVNEIAGFFEQTIASMAVELGANAKGVSDLFATNQLRREYDRLSPNATYGNPISKHISKQLCLFESWFMTDGGGKNNDLELFSNNNSLHMHLQKLSSKLFKDSKKLYLDAKTQRQKTDKMRKRLESLRSRVDSAEKAGLKKVKGLL